MSCVISHASIFDKAIILVDKRNAVDIIYLNYGKAFDKLPQAFLIDKLLKCALYGTIIRWIHN